VEPAAVGHLVDVDKSQSELILSVGGFVVEGDCEVEGGEGGSEVGGPVVLAGFESDLVGVAIEVALALDTAIEVELVATLLVDSVVVVDLVVLVFEPEVQVVGVSEREPELQFLLALVDLALLGQVERFLQGYSRA